MLWTNEFIIGCAIWNFTNFTFLFKKRISIGIKTKNRIDYNSFISFLLNIEMLNTHEITDITKFLV